MLYYGVNVRTLSTPETYYKVSLDALGDELGGRVLVTKQEYEKAILTQEVTRIMTHGETYYNYEYTPEAPGVMRSIAYYKVSRDPDGNELEEREYISKQDYNTAIGAGNKSASDWSSARILNESTTPPPTSSKSDKPVVNGVYEHIGNGGVSFDVTNENGPTIEIDVGHFGHTTNHIKLFVTKKTLLNLAAMFTLAATQEYGEDYCCASKSRWTDKETGKTIVTDENRGVTGGSVAYQVPLDAETFPKHPPTYHVYIDGKEYTVPAVNASVAYLKSIAAIPDDYKLYEMHSGEGSGVLCDDSELVRLKEGQIFVSNNPLAGTVFDDHRFIGERALVKIKINGAFFSLYSPIKVGELKRVAKIPGDEKLYHVGESFQLHNEVMLNLKEGYSFVSRERTQK